MGRCGGWVKGVALLFVALVASCGNTDSKPSSTGNPFVFQARGRLNLALQVDPTDPKFLYITATLLDPQGNPLRNQRVTFEAEFPDAVFIPENTPANDPLACLDRSGTGNSTRCTNRGAAITDDLGQAKVTLFAIVGSNNAPRNPGRLMRVIVEAPNSLDIASSISVPFTNVGFILGGTLAIIPSAVTFVNPFVDPSKGTTVTFSAQGGRPPYRWDNANKSLGRIDGQDPTKINQTITYSLIGANPGGGLTDTITVIDSTGATATATVTVVFADCTLNLSATTVNFSGARGNEQFDIKVANGVAPFTATHTFPDAGTLAVNDTTGVVTYTIADPPLPVDPDNVLIRDSRGCTGSVAVTITPATPANVNLSANPASFCSIDGETVTITALVTDSQGKPFEGATLFFSTTAGSLDPPPTATTDTAGTATKTLRLPAGSPTATVTGTVAGNIQGSVTITGVTDPPCRQPPTPSDGTTGS